MTGSYAVISSSPFLKGCVILQGMLLCIGAQTMPQNTTSASPTGGVAELAKQLQWRDEQTKSRYLRVREDITRRLFNEVDRFIAANITRSNATPRTVKSGLDALLGRKESDISDNVTFLADLPSGRFLIAGIELPRGGGAIAEDAVSFRAYREAQGRFAFVTEISDLHSSDPGNPFLADLHAKALPTSAAPEEFWFLAWAVVPPQAPPTIAVRLYAFDGRRFRTTWAPGDIIAENAASTVDVVPGGFIIRKLVDKSGTAPHSPATAVHERYILTSQGPIKSGEWESQRQ
jgi:hypothetical protein